jgi:hypothetical protein
VNVTELSFMNCEYGSTLHPWVMSCYRLNPSDFEREIGVRLSIRVARTHGSNGIEVWSQEFGFAETSLGFCDWV